jgi:hypothetical protein
VVVTLSYLAVHYAKDAYKVFPYKEEPIPMPTHAASDYQTWIEFTPNSGLFKVLMPSLPQHVADKINDPKTKSSKKYEIYMSEERDGTIYIVNLISFPDQNEVVLAQEELLNSVMNDMLISDPENNLVATQAGEYKGNKTLDFMIENKTLSYDVRAIAVDKVLIVLSSVTKLATHNPKDFEFFINSFELIPLKEKVEH